MNNSDDLDPRLQHWYKQLAKEQPSPELDAKILAAAQQAIKKPSRWLMPFSIAASLVMVGSLVLYWAKQPETLQQATATSSSQEKRVAELTMAAPPASDAAIEKNSDILSSDGASVHPQIAQEKSLVVVESSASVAMDDKIVDDLKDLGSEQRQNSMDNQHKEIKEEVVNITSLPPQTVIAKQDAPERQQSDNRLSSEEVNPPVVADSAILEQRALAAAPPISAGAIVPLAKMQAAEKKERVGKAKVASTKPIASMMEGVSFGTTREQLLTMDFTCQSDVCTKMLSSPKQANYWGISASQAILQALLRNDKVYQWVFAPQVEIQIVLQAIEPLGVATDSVCDEQKSAVLKRAVNGYLLQIHQQEKSVSVLICAEE